MSETAADIAAPPGRGSDAAAINAPRVSVVMPFRDAEAHIEEAIESMLDQSYRSLEVIAIDDGSVDGSAAIVEMLAARDARIRLIRSERRGFVPALNHGLALARGEFIARMDADDASLPDRLHKQVAFLDSHPETGVVGGQIFAVLDGNVITPPWWINTPIEHEGIAKALRQRNSIYHPTALLRRDVLLAAGGYRTPFTVVQDYDLWLRLVERTRLANLPDRVLRYRFHDNQATERNHELAYLCTWVARHAANERRGGRPDPVRGDARIDRAQVLAWGLDPAVLDTEVDWVRCSHTARMHLWRGHRFRALLAFLWLMPRHPRPFLRRLKHALRNRLAGSRTESLARSVVSPPSPACPASR
ncbi:MAG: glycosyltransferase [Phycisphaerae bacterium]|nr:glycosyltransferase [Phycisphaerae bacterium]